MIITSKEQQVLVYQAWLKQLYTNEYLNNSQNENLKLIADLFFNDNVTRAKQFNVWSNLFSTITDTIANFVWNPVMDLDINLSKFIIDLVSVWQWVFTMNRRDNGSMNGELYLSYIPAEDFLFTNKEYKIITAYEEIEWDKINYYILKQTFEVWVTRNELFKLTSPTDTNWVVVALDKIPQTQHLRDEVRTWLNTPAIFVLQDISLLNKIKQLVYSVDRKLVMFETQFLQEIEQFKILENIQIPDSAFGSDWTVSFNKIWKILASTPWEKWDIKYISNRNDLIADAINYEQTQIKKVSSVTSIPADFLWLEWVSAISWTSRELLMQAFLKTIESYRDKITDYLQNIYEVMWIDTEIIWNDILTKWDKELIEELKIARESGLISQFTWVKLYLGIEDEWEIQKEVDLINNLNTNENNWQD